MALRPRNVAEACSFCAKVRVGSGPPATAMDLENSAPVAIAVVSWNTRELLDSCLRSLHSDVLARRADVWVVDNASTDGSAELVRERHGWATLIAAPSNLGFGRAVNLVAQRSASPWIAPANADVRLATDALSALLRRGASEPRAGIVAPRLLLDDGSTQHSVFAFPTLPFTLAFNLGVARVSARLGDRLMLMGYWNPDRGRPVDWAIGAFLLVRRSAWDAAGGFDERQWMYAEDLDLGWRMARAGWQTFYEPQAIVHHRASAATEQRWGDERDERWLRSAYTWMLRRRGGWRTRAFAVVNVVVTSLQAIVLTPLAQLWPERFRSRSALMRRWARLHLIGLRARAECSERDERR